jgi:D-alanyl-D-alanine carboxypeptidase
MTMIRTQLEEFRTKYGIPALGAGIVTEDGPLVLEAVGERVRGGGDPVRLQDRWHIGSCGKSITAALYARLVERGDAEWDAPLAALFPDMSGVDAGWNRTSIYDPFVCQAGLRANLTKADMLAAFRDSRPLPEQRTEAALKALALPPRRPGRFLYSNMGYVLIGAAIDRIAGVPYESALRTHLLEPLGITSAGFGPPHEVWGHGGPVLALGPLGLVALGRAKPVRPDDVESDNPAVMNPAGRLHLTLEDWARFQRVFLVNGGDFLSGDSIERLVTPAPGRGSRMSPGWARMPEKMDASIAQQGSNTFWVATAVVDRARRRTAMVVCNDGRPRLLRKTLTLSLRLLPER